MTWWYVRLAMCSGLHTLLHCFNKDLSVLPALLLGVYNDVLMFSLNWNIRNLNEFKIHLLWPHHKWGWLWKGNLCTRGKGLHEVLCAVPVPVLWKGREQPEIDNCSQNNILFVLPLVLPFCLLRTCVKSGHSGLPDLKYLGKRFTRMEFTGKTQWFAVVTFKTWQQSYFENVFWGLLKKCKYCPLWGI